MNAVYNLNNKEQRVRYRYRYRHRYIHTNGDEKGVYGEERRLIAQGFWRVEIETERGILVFFFTVIEIEKETDRSRMMIDSFGKCPLYILKKNKNTFFM